MWSAISKIFTKNNSKVQSDCTEAAVMDRGEDRPSDMDNQDAYDTRQAKQRASIKWLLSKAYNNKVPENLKEPFYRDHENQEHLKPQIVLSLANAELYCNALGNIYSDPNYHNLNHWSILQTLARKGIYVEEPSDGAQLTETTLIQTNPLRMSAHMAVTEAIMLLYAKEVVSPDRVVAAVQRFKQTKTSSPENYEQGLLLWISHGCEALRKRIEQDTESNVPNGGGEGDRLHSPQFPKVQDFKDLCDGVALAALISFYCPDELPWSKIRVSYLPTVSESLHNIGLVQSFCQRCLPASIFHMVPEDVTYMRGSMKQNLVVFLADLFNLLEINPAKCVRYQEMDKTSSNEGFPARNAHGVVHKRNLLHSVMSPIPDLRSGLDDSPAPSAFQVLKTTPTHMPLRKTNSFQQSMSEMSEDSLRRGSEDSFVVHRSKNIPTLSSVISDEPLMPARLKSNKEKQNHDSKAEERGETVAAGRPSNWEDSRKISYGGRRSRRSSVSEESQLTIENFGGSQDNINFIGKNPDKEVAVHVGRKISAPAFVENPAVRSSVKDNRSSIQFGYDNGCEKSDDDHEKPQLRRQYSAGAIPPSSYGNKLNNINSGSKENIRDGFVNDLVDGEIKNRLSFADLKKDLITGGGEGRAIQLVYMQQQQQEKEREATTNGTPQSGEKKTTTFATLPNTTTWQQQSSINPQHSGDSNNGTNENGGNGGGNVMASQLNDIKMKLEEKRRHIESEKRRMEVIMNKQRQKVGKAAFLQAVTKGKGNILKGSNDTTEPNSPGGSEPRSPSTDTVPKAQRPLTLQEISDDVVNVEKKWLNQDQPFVETRRTPDIENMDLEQYQQSIAQMNSSLQNIQVDIQRLSSQQNQIQAAQQQVYSQQMQNYQPIPNYQQPPVSQYPPTFTTQQFNPPGAIYNHPLQSYSSAPHIPQAIYGQKGAPSPNVQQQEPHFYLHDQSMMAAPSPQPPTPQRRTWATPPPPPADHVPFQQPEMRTWGKPQNPNSFVLHDVPPNDSSRFVDNGRFQNAVSSPKYHQRDHSPKYQQNGEEYPLNRSNSHPGFTLSQQHMAQQHLIRGSPSASPQHRNIHKQISQLMDEGKRTTVPSTTSTPVSLHQIDNRELRKSSITHAPIPAPPADDMEPQNISFIGSGGDQISEGISKLNITSGTRTYRIPSPTRPLVTRAFQTGQSIDRSSVEKESPPLAAEVTSLDKDPTNEKGFYISFDNEQPKRPKPPLRGRKGSPKKSFNEIPDDVVSFTRQNVEQHHEETRQERQKSMERELALERMKREDREYERQKQEQMERDRQRERRETSQEKQKVTAASAIIIGNELSNPDPDVMDEKEKKKERIMLMSLQRRQQQEEAKARKEAEAEARREREKAKEEERQRKKEEQAARRAAILEQYKLKKAMEEAEREGKVLDRSELSSLKPTPKMRPKGSVTRPRPKTIHIDSGSVEMAEGMLQPSRGKKGSSSNLTANHYSSTTPIKRDYYRGSQDSLADAGRIGNSLLYRDSPDDSRGVSPCNSANQTLGRRGSYKTTSRDPSPAQSRGRPKYPTYKGRKSTSMMNLYGSSVDQDSLAYRYGDTDSGLGRATPPRRAPSPGMGTIRHLTSPSGPGSLPGFMSKRRIFDDGSSDISSTPSSMVDYTGPRLYKQPTTKSNRGIMLNAVEYCVFPGAVNKEAKKRVLEEINRSEAKHFLILFRDAGCQFRALYSYCPEREEVTKLYGTGPKQVNDRMFDKFFKYNSGGKCFSQVHTKHLTVTIDAFTIHNSLWQGKKVNLPNKKDMALVI